MIKKIAMMFFMLTIFLLHACGGGGSPAPSQSPSLYNLAVDLNDFDFAALQADSNRNPYIAFGAPFRDGYLNATFEYYLNAGSTIVSPVNGTVIELEYKDPLGDYTMSLEATGSPDWKIIIDHVQQPTIALNDTVVAGQALGVAGVWEKTFGRTELQIFNNNDRLSYCPTAFLASDVSATIKQELTELMTSWMAYTGNENAYYIDLMDPVGCLATTVQG